MTLRHDVRDYFEREARRMPAPAGLRPDISTRVSGSVAVRPASLRWAAVMAALLAIAIVAGLMAAGGLRHLLRSSPVPGLQPGAHGYVLDADLVDSRDGWVLLADCRARILRQADNSLVDACRFWVESTHDAGLTWTDPVQVGGWYAQSTIGDTFRHIHFANRTDGFVYGLGFAFVSHDGGRSWSQLPWQTHDLLAITGYVVMWAVFQSRVQYSTDYGRTWNMTEAMPAGFAPSASAVPVAGGTALLLLSDLQNTMVFVFEDGTFGQQIHGKCPLDDLATVVATPGPTAIYQYCSGARSDTAYVSTDSGTSWIPLSSPVNGTVGPMIVSVRPGFLLLLTSTEAAVTSTLYASQDSGRTWHLVQSARGFLDLVFSETGDGWAYDDYDRIWATTDGGLSWVMLPSVP
ncbi:MAG TPA: hypothetical protein VGV88_05935 [Candidatus Dormibacteraeota bacterium]|nr:hypothetical protein [Candidatus Dormibacteraeota bacterium]